MFIVIFVESGKCFTNDRKFRKIFGSEKVANFCSCDIGGNRPLEELIKVSTSANGGESDTGKIY